MADIRYRCGTWSSVTTEGNCELEMERSGGGKRAMMGFVFVLRSSIEHDPVALAAGEMSLYDKA